MQSIYADYEKVNIAGGTAIAIGNFDGVHKGHEKMLCALKRIAYEKGIPSVVYTFLNHPVNQLNKGVIHSTIYDNLQKESFISKLGIHTLFFENFLSVKDLSPEEFVKEILVEKLNIKAAVMGQNGSFGKNGKGNAKTLLELGKKYGFFVQIVESLEIDGEICSSSLIRNELTAGNVKKAQKLLGRSYAVTGKVIKDKQLGRTYGYPTANILPPKNSVRLKNGVYSTNTIFDGRTYKSITNVGTTSFDDNEEIRIETFILDFEKNLYGENITIEFLNYLRDFMSFTSVEELKNQLDEDKKNRRFEV